MNHSFTRILKLECKKAIHNKFFYITLAIACIFTILSAWYTIETYLYWSNPINTHGSLGNPQIEATTLYNQWIGGESISLGFIFFFTLLPLLATLPYGWSYFIEIKNGYVKTMILRTGKWQYFLAKYIAVFITGGLVIFIPLLVNLLIVACFIPAITPTTIYPLAYSVNNTALWSQLFYTYPLIYTLLYLGLNFLFSGLFATMSLTTSFFIKNRIAVLLIPFFLLLILHYCRTFTSYVFYYEISPIFFLHATGVENPTSALVVIFEGIVFFLLTFGLTMKLGVKREIL